MINPWQHNKRIMEPGDPEFIHIGTFHVFSEDECHLSLLPPPPQRPPRKSSALAGQLNHSLPRALTVTNGNLCPLLSDLFSFL